MSSWGGSYSWYGDTWFYSFIHSFGATALEYVQFLFSVLVAKQCKINPTGSISGENKVYREALCTFILPPLLIHHAIVSNCTLRFSRALRPFGKGQRAVYDTFLDTFKRWLSAGKCGWRMTECLMHCWTAEAWQVHTPPRQVMENKVEKREIFEQRCDSWSALTDVRMPAWEGSSQVPPPTPAVETTQPRYATL